MNLPLHRLQPVSLRRVQFGAYFADIRRLRFFCSVLFSSVLPLDFSIFRLYNQINEIV